MKKITVILSMLLLLAALILPVYGATDYNLVYDATDLLNEEYCTSMGETVLPALSETYKTQIRVDVVSDTEGETLEDYAQIFYDGYGYGYEGTYDGYLLMIHLVPDDTGLSLVDYHMMYGGENQEFLSGFVTVIYDRLETWMTSEMWAGSLEQDNAVFMGALQEYMSCAESYLNGTITADESEPGAPIEEPISEPTEEPVDEPTEEPISDPTQEPAGNTEDNLTGINLGIAGVDEIPVFSNFVTDAVGILAKGDAEKLERKAEKISDQYELNVYIAAVDDYYVYDTESVYEAAKTIYKDYDLGYGSDKDGLFLLLSMADRDYALIAYGDKGNSAFTDYGKEMLKEAFLDDFAEDDWYAGFDDYLEQSEELLQLNAEGKSPSYYKIPLVIVLSIIFALLFGALVALIVCSILKSKMKSVAVQSSAAAYIAKDGVDFAYREDRFVRRTQTRRYIEPKSSSSGGSKTTVDRDGFSGTSGKF